jgi:hypothetical protein
VLEVRDSKFEGGARHRYHLRLGDFPLLNTPFPLSVPGGSAATVQFAGPDAAGLKPVRVTPPAGAVVVPLSVAFPKGAGSGFVKLGVSDGPEPVEQEPNDTPGAAQAIELPAAVNGRLAGASDRDWYSFAARKGQRIVFAARTRSQGSPAELYLRVCQADGTSIAEGIVAGPEETSLTNTFDADATFKVLVEELTRRGGPEYTYRLEIGPLDPGFILSTDVEKAEAVPGGSFDLKLTATRRNFDGPITLELSGLGGGFGWENNVIAEKKNEATLRVHVPAGAVPGQVLLFGVRGTAKVSEREVRVTAGTLPALRKLFPDQRFPPAELDGRFALGIRAPSGQ